MKFKALLNHTLGTYGICPICNWEDDEVQFYDPTYAGGANKLCLKEAQEKYRLDVNKKFVASLHKTVIKKGNNKMHDNLTFEKIWQDENLIELKISASSEYVSAYQKCYIEDTALENIAEKICSYVNNYKEPCYLEFGKKEGNYTPAFSMCLIPADMSGHVKIEVDIEIDDNDTRAHRCCFYVNSELGLVERLGMSLKELVTGKLAEVKCMI